MPLYVEMSGDEPTRFFFADSPPRSRSNYRIKLVDGDRLVDPYSSELEEVLQSLPQTHRNSGTAGIVVTCHEKYLKWLPQCLESIDSQTTPFSTKILSLDRTTLPEGMSADGWQVITGDWGTPNPARNEGLARCSEDWVVFFDADNLMPQGYLEAMLKNASDAEAKIAYFYPDIRICDQTMRPIRFNRTPEWSEEGLSRGNFVDTSSLWRREALHSVGGWGFNQPTEDDYYLCMRMMHRGWTGCKAADVPPMLYREHPNEQGRWSDAWHGNRESEALWLIREALVIVPSENTVTGQRCVDWICSQELPEKGRVVLLCGDSSGSWISQLLDRVGRVHPQMSVEVVKLTTPEEIVASSVEDMIYVLYQPPRESASALREFNALMPPSHVPDISDPSKLMDGPRYVGGVIVSRKDEISLIAAEGWVARQSEGSLADGLRNVCGSLDISLLEVR